MVAVTVGRAAEVWPGDTWATARPAEVGLAEERLAEARDYALTGGGSGMIVRRGRVVLTWGDLDMRYDVKSTSKSIGVTLLGVAWLDGKVGLDDPAVKHHPEFALPPAANAAKGWRETITLRQLAAQTAGFAKVGGYTELLFAPGTEWHYSDGGPNWLAECLTLAYGKDLNDVMFERVFGPLGLTPDEIRWRKHAYRPPEIAGVARREFGSGFHANANALARIGLLYLRDGRWRDRRILPEEFVRLARTTDPRTAELPVRGTEHGHAARHYGLLWWNNGDGTLPGVPKDAYWSWGLYDSLIVVVPSLDLVAVRAGRSWRRTTQGHYDVLRPFLGPLVAAVKNPVRSGVLAPERAPYPPSPAIRAVRWAPPETIVRLAPGSDNWPLTWGDDDALYGAYGDGQGFRPFVPRKLSLGLARITGRPPELAGTNLRSPDIERTGDGRAGAKASGLLMVDGVLYLLARNRDNAQLAWSRDRGATWTWADWRFGESFGCPTFLNFGPDYAGARDGFVYVYSKDGDSAYDGSDAMVLARVPRGRIAERAAYEFFAGTAAAGAPRWTPEIAGRRPVFSHPGNCYRSAVTYAPALRRYLWTQVYPGSRHPQGPRFQGGFGIYDAPEPWGPWTTAFHTPAWDVGPGDTNVLPAKWMSADGRTVHLVFAGEDSFSVRAAQLELAAEP
jgi:CubicO group peptidase (beta-lactamase class C family)